MSDMRIKAEIQCSIGIGSRDDVPPGASAANVIERCEAPRHMIGLVERGRCRGDETDAARQRRNSGKQRERLERRDRVAALQSLLGHVEHGKMIGHEEGVELRRFQFLRKRDDMGKVEIRVRIRPRIPPGSGMEADGAHEGAQMKLPFGQLRSPSRLPVPILVGGVGTRLSLRFGPIFSTARGR